MRQFALKVYKEQEKQMDKKAPLAMLVVLYGSAFIAGFNENLVNMALLSIMNDFSIDSITAQWLVTGYMIVATVVVMSMAVLYQRFPLRRLYFIAALFSFVGSTLGLFSPNFEVLMVARLIQALGTGIFIPLMMNTILIVTPKNKLGTYFSIGGCMITFGPAFAPVVCGAVVSAFGWRYIFAMPTIVVLILAIIAIFCVKNLENHYLKLDVASVGLAALLLFALSFGLAQVMVDWTIGAPALALFVLTGILFVIRQLKVDNPLINLNPMKSIRFWPSILMTSIAMIGTFSCSVLLPIYFEGACGLIPFIAGLVLLIPVLSNCVATIFAGRLFDRFGECPLLPLGFACVTAGFLLLTFFSSTLSLQLVFFAAIVVYAGTGLIFSPSQTAGLKTLTREENPYGVALTNTFVQIAACIGPSLYTGLMTFGQNASVNAATNANLALAEGFSLAMTVASVFALVGTCVGFFYARAARKRVSGAAAESVCGAEESTSLLQQIMQTTPWCINEHASVRSAMSMMVKKEVGGLPLVNDNHEVVGFVSDGDIMRYIAEKSPSVTSSYSLLEMANNQTLEEKVNELLRLEVGVIATNKAISIDLASTLEEACNLLADKKLKKLPVIDDGKIVGTINRSDIMRFIMQQSLQA